MLGFRRMALFLLMGWVISSYGQSFPVTCNVNLSGAEIPYLYSILEENPSRVTATINLNDPVRPRYDVFLKIEITGNGISLRTKTNFQGPIFTLDFGVPTRLNGIDLIDHLKPENLDFIGITQSDFLREGRLPEGGYTFCIEAYDINRPEIIPISNRGCAAGMVRLYDPPILLNPNGNHPFHTNQNINFQWQSNHIGIDPSYNLIICERVPGLTDDQAFNLSRLVTIKNIIGNNYWYGPSEYLLPPDRDYLVFVEVNNEMEYSFKNRGISPPLYFRMYDSCIVGQPCDDNDPCTSNDKYDANCLCSGENGEDKDENGIPDICESETLLTAPFALPAAAIETEKFTARWKSDGKADYYLLEVAKDDEFKDIVPGYSAIKITADSSIVNSVDLKNYHYYRLRAVEGNRVSPYSNVIAVVSDSDCFPTILGEVDCAIEALDIGQQSSTLLKNLKRGDQFFAGSFPVRITSISGANPYSGQGYIPAPFTNNKGRLQATFKNVLINDDCQLIGDGFVNVTGAKVQLLETSLQEWVDFLSGLEQEIEDFEETIGEVNNLINDTEILDDYLSQDLDISKPDLGILEEYPDLPDSTLDIMQEALTCLKNNLEYGGDVNDCKKQWEVGLQKIAETIDELFDASQQIKFLDSEESTYAYDGIPYRDTALMNIYDEIKIANQPYPIAWKMVGKGDNDWIKVDGNDLSTIIFKDNDNNILPSKTTPEGTLVNISGNRDGAFPIYAVENSGEVKYAGKLNVLSYDELVYTLKIIPINGINFPLDVKEASTWINETFTNAQVKVDLQVSEPITVGAFNGVMPADTSGFFENYTSLMDRINGSANNNDLEWVLFLIAGHEDKNKLGYWPRGRKYGYLFSENNMNAGTTQYLQTIAHEFAHGGLRLAHIYEEVDSSPGKTNNLMDYGGGEKLYGYQWQLIHEPRYELEQLADDREGGKLSLKNIDYQCISNTTRKVIDSEQYQLIDLNNKAIKLNPSSQVVAFTGMDEDVEFRGALASFYEQDIIYGPWIKFYQKEGGKYAFEFTGEYIPYGDQGEPLVLEKSDGSYVRILAGEEDEALIVNENGKVLNRVPQGFQACPAVINKERYYASTTFKDQFISFVGEDYEEILRETSAIKEVRFEADKNNLLDRLTSNVYYSYDFEVEDEIVYFGELMNDRLSFYADETGVKMKVILQRLDYALSDQDLKEIEVSIRNNKEDLDLILYFGIYEELGISARSIRENSSLFHIRSVVVDDQQMLGIETKGVGYSSLQKFILDLFSSLDKPYLEVINWINPAGQIASQIIPQRKMRGKDALASFYWLEHKDRGAYKKLQDEVSILLRQRVVDYAQVRRYRDQQIAMVVNAEGNRDLENYNIRREFKLKEKFIKEYHRSFSDVYQNGISLSGNFQIYTGLTDLPKEALYQFSARELMYALLDIGSVIPLVGLAFDIAGMAVSAYNGDALRFAEYGLGVFLQAELIVEGSKRLIQKSSTNSIDRYLINKDGDELLEVSQASKEMQAAAIAQHGGLGFEDATLLADKVDQNVAHADLLYRKEVYDEIREIGEEAEKIRLIDNMIGKMATLRKGLEDKLTSSGMPSEMVDKVAEDVWALFKARNLSLQDLTDEFAELLVRLGEGSTTVLAKIRSFEEGSVKALISDLQNQPFRDFLVRKREAGVEVWDELRKAYKALSRTNPIALKNYAKLNENVKNLILKFSDEAPNSTFSKFLDELEDREFLDFINKVENENVVKSFVSHKDGVDLSDITDKVAEKVLNDLKGLEGDVGLKARKWNERSTKITSNNTIFAKARKFEVEDPEIPDSGVARRRFLNTNDLNDLQVVNQVTLEVDGTKIRIDYLGRDGDELFHLGDAKFSTKNKNWNTDWMSASTPNQKIALPKIIEGKDITIRATDLNKIQAIENNLGIKLTDGQYTIKSEDLGSIKIIGSEADDYTKIKLTIDLLN